MSIQFPQYCLRPTKFKMALGVPNFTMRYRDGALADMVALRDIQDTWVRS